MHKLMLAGLIGVFVATTPTALVQASYQPNVAQRYQVYHEYYTQMARQSSRMANGNAPWEADSTMASRYPNGQIPYYIDPSTRESSAWLTGIKMWNALGIIRFYQVNDPSQAAVILTDYANVGTYIPGKTISRRDASDNDGTTIYYPDRAAVAMLSDHINNAKNFKAGKYWQSAPEYAGVVAAHELGHVLGFAHDNRTYRSYSVTKNYTFDAVNDQVVPDGVIGKTTGRFAFVMNAGSGTIPINHTFALGDVEKQALQQHYPNANN